jgi:hypothetical protein
VITWRKEKKSFRLYYWNFFFKKIGEYYNWFGDSKRLLGCPRVLFSSLTVYIYVYIIIIIIIIKSGGIDSIWTTAPEARRALWVLGLDRSS